MSRQLRTVDQKNRPQIEATITFVVLEIYLQDFAFPSISSRL